MVWDQCFKIEGLTGWTSVSCPTTVADAIQDKVYLIVYHTVILIRPSMLVEIFPFLAIFIS
jgi:hypothetical protein